MKKLWLVLPLLLSEGSGLTQVDRLCLRAGCQYLVVRDGDVRFVDKGLFTDVSLGSYVAADQRLVHATEAPIRDLRSPTGWHVVVSALIDHREGGAETEIRVFGPGGELRATYAALMLLERADMGRLFGGADEILAITTNEEHVYNDSTVVWLLRRRGAPKELLTVNGTIDEFSRAGAGDEPGVWISRETYDGTDSATKGHVREFWEWDAASEQLRAAGRSGPQRLGSSSHLVGG